MKNIQTVADKTAIGLSLLCTLHCLAMPLAAVLLPTSAAMTLEDELFHHWILIAVFPVSAYALTMGCKKHKHYRLLAVGGIGLFILAVAAVGGHDRLGEIWEKTLTVIGATTIALGHLWNYRLCRRQDCCECGGAKQADLQANLP